MTVPRLPPTPVMTEDSLPPFDVILWGFCAFGLNQTGLAESWLTFLYK